MLRAVSLMAAVVGLVSVATSSEAATITTLKVAEAGCPTSDALFPAGRDRMRSTQLLACHRRHVLTAFVVQGDLARGRQQDD